MLEEGAGPGDNAPPTPNAPLTPTLPSCSLSCACSVLALPLVTRGLEDVVLWKYEACPHALRHLKASIRGALAPHRTPCVLCSRLPPRHAHHNPLRLLSAEEQAQASEKPSRLSEVAELVEPQCDSRGCAHFVDEETEAEDGLTVTKTGQEKSERAWGLVLTSHAAAAGFLSFLPTSPLKPHIVSLT